MTKLLSKTADQPKNEIVEEALAAAKEEGRNFIVLNVWETTVLDYCMPDVFVLPVGKDHGVRANWLFLDNENTVREDFTLQTLLDEYWIRDSDFNYDAQINPKFGSNPEPQKRIEQFPQVYEAICKVQEQNLPVLTLPTFNLESEMVMKTNFLLQEGTDPTKLENWEELYPGTAEPISGATLENNLEMNLIMPSDFDWTSQKLVYLDNEDLFEAYLCSPKDFLKSEAFSEFLNQQ